MEKKIFAAWAYTTTNLGCYIPMYVDGIGRAQADSLDVILDYIDDRYDVRFDGVDNLPEDLHDEIETIISDSEYRPKSVKITDAESGKIVAIFLAWDMNENEEIEESVFAEIIETMVEEAYESGKPYDMAEILRRTINGVEIGQIIKSIQK